MRARRTARGRSRASGRQHAASWLSPRLDRITLRRCTKSVKVSTRMDQLSDRTGRLFEALASLAALILLAMVVLVTADIVLRNLVGRGFAWSNEVTEYALYLITLLTAPW